MLSINTNISSLITQRSMKSATNLLNQAVERMSTGYKVNHAKDNAAAYSIITNMDTKIGAYQVAEDNCAMGMDLVTTATDIISQMQDMTSRLRALSTQARNSTYGEQSLAAINSEANAIISEMTRLYMTSEYNGIDLFNRKAYEIAEDLKASGANTADIPELPDPNLKIEGFIENPVSYSQLEVEALDPISAFAVGANGTYKIMSADDLAALANIVNTAQDTTGATFVLGADIDLTEWQSIHGDWVPIGDYSSGTSNVFKGTFDGNGHVVKNLKINRQTTNYQGLFGYMNNKDASIKNLGLSGAKVHGQDYVGGLCAYFSSSLSNCYVEGEVKGSDYVGGLIGYFMGLYSNGTFLIDDSYAKVNIEAQGEYAGIFLGRSQMGPSCTMKVEKSYAFGFIRGNDYVGGFTGGGAGALINDCYAYSEVLGNDHVGGFTSAYGTITNCVAMGNVQGVADVGGFAGNGSITITNCLATGNVQGTTNVGGFSGSGGVNNCTATGNVKGTTNVGGFVGDGGGNNCTATGNVKGTTNVGGFAGKATGFNKSYATGNVSGVENVGGLIGSMSVITTGDGCYDSYSTGSVTGEKFVGGLIGQFLCAAGVAIIENCSSYSKINGNEKTGTLIGAICNKTDSYPEGTITITDCQSIAQDGIQAISGCYTRAGADPNFVYTLNTGFDMTAFLAGNSDVPLTSIDTTLQVGVSNNTSSRLSFDTNFDFNLSEVGNSIQSDSALKAIDEFSILLNEKSITLGAMQNRLESALDEISTQYENLVSSRSTLRDADIAEVSSQYVQQQILQQASATLMATANQAPAIALQLI